MRKIPPILGIVYIAHLGISLYLIGRIERVEFGWSTGHESADLHRLALWIMNPVFMGGIALVNDGSLKFSRTGSDFEPKVFFVYAMFFASSAMCIGLAFLIRILIRRRYPASTTSTADAKTKLP